MATTDKTIQEDINKSKQEYRIEGVEMVDGKITACFVIEKNQGQAWGENQSDLPEDERYSYTRIDKVFDNWSGFTEYSEVFFKNQN